MRTGKGALFRKAANVVAWLAGVVVVPSLEAAPPPDRKYPLGSFDRRISACLFIGMRN
jgi:hypothetical protein